MDKVLLSGIGGALAALVMEGIPLLANFFGIHSTTYTQMNMYMFMGVLQASSLTSYIAGFLGHLVAGAFASCLFIHYLYWTKDYQNILSKALFYGTVLWLVAFGFVSNVIIKITDKHTGLCIIIALGDHLVYGIVLALFIDKYQIKLFGKEPSKNR